MSKSVHIEGESLIVDLGCVVDRLDVSDRRRLFKFIMWDEETLKWFVDFIIEGWAGEDGDMPGRELAFELRKRFIAHADEAVGRALAELAAAYAYQARMVRFYQNQASDLERAWPYDELPRDEEGRITRRPPERKEYPYGPHISGDDELPLAEDIRRLVVRCTLCGREKDSTSRRKLPAIPNAYPEIPERWVRCCHECWTANTKEDP